MIWFRRSMSFLDLDYALPDFLFIFFPVQTFLLNSDSFNTISTASFYRGSHLSKITPSLNVTEGVSTFPFSYPRNVP